MLTKGKISKQVTTFDLFLSYFNAEVSQQHFVSRRMAESVL